MSWLEVKIQTIPNAVDDVSNILYDAGAGGVVIEDSIDDKDICEWDYIEKDDFKRKDNTAIVKGYIPEGSDLTDKLNVIKFSLNNLKKYMDIGLGSVETNLVHEEDWENSWKKYYNPVKIGDRIVVKPDWESYEKKDGEIIISIDPGMAFGTGTHDTTKMCIQMLDEFVKKDMAIADVGCGSAILSIAAAKLGARKVLAIDIDTVAVRVAQENVKKNNVSDIIEVIRSDGLAGTQVKYDIVIANIIADVIIKITEDVKNSLNNGGIFITSGIIKDRENDVSSRLTSEGFSIIKRITSGEWVALGLKINKDE